MEVWHVKTCTAFQAAMTLRHSVVFVMTGTIILPPMSLTARPAGRGNAVAAPILKLSTITRRRVSIGQGFWAGQGGESAFWGRPGSGDHIQL